jgi:LacI family transcriptional regulator
MTIGALEELGSRGVEPGRDLAVVGFDDINWGTALRPPLTAVSQPTYEIGQRTAELLLRRIRGEQLPLQRIVLPAKLVIRASSIRVR